MNNTFLSGSIAATVKAKKPFVMTRARRANANRYSAIKNSLQTLANLSIPADIAAHAGITQSEINALYKRVLHSTRQLSHSFTMCPTCKVALTNRKPRRDIKNNMRFENCTICGKPPETYNISYFKYRTKYTLEQAQAKLSVTHPELFV